MRVTNRQLIVSLSCCFAAAMAGVGQVYTGAGGAIVFGALALLASLLTLAFAWRYRDQPERTHRQAETIATIGLMLFLPAILLFGLLPALLILLSFAQLGLNMQLAEHKHVHYGIVVSFICLFMGAAKAISGYYLVYITAYAAAAAICLSQLDADRRGVRAIPLWSRANLTMILWLVCMSVAIYLVMPRPPAANFGSQYSEGERYYKASEWDKTANNNDGADGNSTASGGESVIRQHTHTSSGEGFDYPGFHDNFDINDRTINTALGNPLLALMSAPHGAYLNIRTFDHFDGRHWHQHRGGRTLLNLRHQVLELDAGKEANFQQTITVQRNLGPYIPFAPVAVKVHFPADKLARDAYHSLRLPGNLAANTVYTVESALRFHQQRLFTGTELLPGDQDLELPEGLDSRIAKLAADVTHGMTDPMQQALGLESYLRENYRYDFGSVLSSQHDTPLDRFLFETRAGHCEYFASALAILLRSRGIPTRLVTGYSAMIRNPLTGYYEIHALDGHAWVEAWMGDEGWMLLEPTPPFPLPQQSSSNITFDQIQDYVEQLERYTEIGGQQAPTLVGLWASITQLITVLAASMKALIREHAVLLCLCTGVLIAVWLLYRRYRNSIIAWLVFRKVRTYRQRGDCEDARFYLRQLNRMLALRGIARSPGDSLETLCRNPPFDRLDPTQQSSLASQLNVCFYGEGGVVDKQLFKTAVSLVYEQPLTITIGEFKSQVHLNMLSLFTSRLRKL